MSDKWGSLQKEGSATIKYNSQYLSNESTVVTVNKPSFSPKIKITDYPDQTSESSVQISGNVSDKSDDDIEVTCNGKGLFFCHVYNLYQRDLQKV